MVKIKCVGVISAGRRFRYWRRRSFGWVGMETNKPLPALLDPGDSCEHWTRAEEFCDDMTQNQGCDGVVAFCGYAVDVEGRIHRSKFIKIDFDRLSENAATAHESGRGALAL